MGKRIIPQARGKGSLTYRVRKKAFRHKIRYPNIPPKLVEAEIIDLIKSGGHTAPLLKIKLNSEMFYNPAFNSAFIGQKISLLPQEPKQGDIALIKNIPLGAQVYNIEINPGDGGRMIRTAGSSATVLKKYDKKISVLMPNKKEKMLDPNCRVTLGSIAGSGRLLKPVMKAGRRFHKMRSRGKLWPRVSAVSVNAIDHPFGSGRGKRVKSKIAKRNAPPGRRVGHLRPKRTGYKR
jgi:large subunit ribosomal protein L2